MMIYPAVDLRGGRVVRLQEGKVENETVFSDDPVAVAKLWIEQGARWLHMVNLDGAFSEVNDNGIILENVAKLGVKVQFGGGLRSLDSIRQALDQGASRVVVGTLAIEQPDIVVEAINQFGSDAICVALDSRDGKVTTKGWREDTGLLAVELGKQLKARGIEHALYTDVQRDGKLTGVNIEETVNLAQETTLQVIASGGVGTVAEITELVQSQVVAGVIIGMALYEGKLTLPDALAATRGEYAG